jgi:hypothetical protein
MVILVRKSLVTQNEYHINIRFHGTRKMPAVKPVLLITAVTMRVQKVWLPIEADPLVGRGEMKIIWW